MLRIRALDETEAGKRGEIGSVEIFAAFDAEFKSQFSRFARSEFKQLQNFDRGYVVAFLQQLRNVHRHREIGAEFAVLRDRLRVQFRRFFVVFIERLVAFKDLTDGMLVQFLQFRPRTPLFAAGLIFVKEERILRVDEVVSGDRGLVGSPPRGRARCPIAPQRHGNVKSNERSIL